MAAAHQATTQGLDVKILSGVDAEACPPGSDAHARLAQLVSLLCNPATPVASFFVQAKTMQTQVLMGAGRGGASYLKGNLSLTPSYTVFSRLVLHRAKHAKYMVCS